MNDEEDYEESRVWRCLCSENMVGLIKSVADAADNIKRLGTATEQELIDVLTVSAEDDLEKAAHHFYDMSYFCNVDYRTTEMEDTKDYINHLQRSVEDKGKGFTRSAIDDFVKKITDNTYKVSTKCKHEEG